MQYQLEFSRQALKSLLGLPKPDAHSLLTEIKALAMTGEHAQAKNPLQQPGHRLHLGNYRVLYSKSESPRQPQMSAPAISARRASGAVVLAVGRIRVLAVHEASFEPTSAR